MLQPISAAGDALVRAPRMKMEERKVKVKNHGLPATHLRVMNQREMNFDKP